MNRNLRGIDGKAELPVVMRFPPRSSIPLFLLGLVITCANAEFSDPVGYMAFKLVGGMKGSMAVPLAQGYRWIGPVAAAGPDYVESASNLPNDLLGAGNSACLDVRSGPGAGQSLRVTSVSGRRVYFEGPALTALTTGVMVGVRPNWTLGEMLGSPPFGDIQQGPTHVEADVIGLQDPATQTIREFFYKTEEGWREIGHAEEGDRSTVAVPFRSSLQFHRKAPSDLSVVMFGAVPMFGAAHHWVRVWPGRNLITTPFSPARKIKDFIDVSSLNSGLSAARSDTFRLVYEDASLSKSFSIMRSGVGRRLPGKKSTTKRGNCCWWKTRGWKSPRRWICNETAKGATLSSPHSPSHWQDPDPSP
jgi:hypothetical protein